jgi:hypothetical protein
LRRQRGQAHGIDFAPLQRFQRLGEAPVQGRAIRRDPGDQGVIVLDRAGDQADPGLAVNCVKMTGAPIPFGGIKQSGLGREGSRHGLEEFTELKYVCIAFAKAA